MNYTEDEITFIKNNYPQKGPKELSFLLNKSVDLINNILKKLNIRGQINKKYDSFDFDLSNKEHIYLMGFIWADGYIHDTLNRLELSILTDDFNDLSYMIDDSSWAIYHRNRKNRKPQTTIGLYKDDVCNIFREKYNYTEKSYKCPNFLDKISKDLLKYFIRGFFDGDGCFYISKDNKQKQCYLAGTYEQDWSWIENILKEIGVEYNIKQKIQNKNKINQSKYSVVYINRSSIEIFGKYIYNDYDGIGLLRKYNKFIMLNL